MVLVRADNELTWWRLESGAERYPDAEYVRFPNPCIVFKKKQNSLLVLSSESGMRKKRRVRGTANGTEHVTIIT